MPRSHRQGKASSHVSIISCQCQVHFWQPFRNKISNAKSLSTNPRFDAFTTSSMSWLTALKNDTAAESTTPSKILTQSIRPTSTTAIWFNVGARFVGLHWCNVTLYSRVDNLRKEPLDRAMKLISPDPRSFVVYPMSPLLITLRFINL